MRNLNIFLFVVAGCLSVNVWAHADIDWNYPLNIECEQLDHKQNNWTARHLFIFEQDGNPNFHDGTWETAIVKGKYKSHVYVLPPGEAKELRSNILEGIASFEASNIHDLYNISAMGFLKTFDDKSGIPQVVIGADIEIGKDVTSGKTSFKPIQRDVEDHSIDAFNLFGTMPSDYSRTGCAVLIINEHE